MSRYTVRADTPSYSLLNNLTPGYCYGVTWNELIRKIKAVGWKLDRQASDSHQIYRHPNYSYPIIIAQHGSREVGTGLANDLLKKAGVK
jgi:predicted RNA binding protein YcfA (HicA-like mRNA interferase family)